MSSDIRNNHDRSGEGPKLFGTKNTNLRLSHNYEGERSPDNEPSARIPGSLPPTRRIPPSLLHIRNNHDRSGEVFSQVKQWTDEFDSDEELSAESVDDRACSLSATSYIDTRHCLAKIIGDLTLAFVHFFADAFACCQHSTCSALGGNTLVAISEFVLASDRSWDDFMHLLCLCLELAFCNSLTSSESDALEPDI
ncbi:hypothetical protein Sango_1806200 [Sesamum angolense]|uniref:Uncharacterized protein n=1 Tax=Sesamum angolense TaxID=2727404 RepID=A0AAE1WH16_9LAMI|nr:hypothetical protein Sango_1806200 [Sesamum angolense]